VLVAARVRDPAGLPDRGHRVLRQSRRAMLRRVGVLGSDRRAATGLPLTPFRLDCGLTFLFALMVVNGRCSGSTTVGVGLANGGGSFGIDAKFWLIGVDEDFLAPAAI
jgi:hypothetical protein